MKPIYEESNLAYANEKNHVMFVFTGMGHIIRMIASSSTHSFMSLIFLLIEE